MKYIICVNNGEDFIKKTGLGNTWIYSDRKNATRFDNKEQAQKYINTMPKTMKLSPIAAN